jgi:hypothetical protein
LGDQRSQGNNSCHICGKNITQWVKDPVENINWAIRLFPTKSGSYVCTMCDPEIESDCRANRRAKKDTQTSMF